MTNPVPQNDSRASKVPGGRRLLVIGAAALVAVGLAIPAAIFGPQLVGLGQPANEAPPNPAPAGAPNPPELTEFRNDQIGFTLSYPASWVPRQLKDQPEHPSVLLRVSDEEGKKALLIRALELPKAVSKEELPTAKQELDQLLLSANPTIEVRAESEPFELAGMPGYLYVYTTKDEPTGQQIGHSHFFFFKGTTLLIFVFEAIPAEAYEAAVPDFNQIINSFRML